MPRRFRAPLHARKAPGRSLERRNSGLCAAAIVAAWPRHACKALAAAGVESVVFDLAQAVQFGPLVTDDVRDSRALADCIRRYAIGAVLHFAGLMEVGRSMVKPPEFWDVNLDGVAAVLASMRTAAYGVLSFYRRPPSTALLQRVNWTRTTSQARSILTSSASWR